ncbi:MAG: sugar transferase [Gemmatimonadaceae bacterium]|nr:sugar transferase [Gemmatimonadaceae bacterium]
MTLIALACIARYGRNIPLAEDWLMVPPMTGHEPRLASWLWAQNNEHRLPLPRLILLGVLMATHDFRAGMVLNVLSLAALAAAMMLAARHLRGGVTRASDAFFPLALLHLGDWENLVWGWQFQFVCSAVLICALMLAIVRQRGAMTMRQALGLDLEYVARCGLLLDLGILFKTVLVVLRPGDAE